MSVDERRMFLKGLVSDVEDGMRAHPGSRDLSALLRDLQREVLGLAVATP
jgi:hypothetical protein